MIRTAGECRNDARGAPTHSSALAVELLVLLSEVLKSDFESDFESDLDSDLDSELDGLLSELELEPAESPSPLRGALGLPLKSVSYQPVPLSWKPTADTSFFKDSLPQVGQVVSRESLMRCMTSSLCWQS